MKTVSQRMRLDARLPIPLITDPAWQVNALPTLHMLLHIAGGKGGFGSMLRMLGKNITEVDNTDACRDINGRRLRHVNSEKKLTEWYAMEAERKAEAEAAKRERRIAKAELAQEYLAVEKDAVIKAERMVLLFIECDIWSLCFITH